VNLRWTLPLLLATAVPGTAADGPRDNLEDHVRPVPPPGISIEPGEAAQLTMRLEALAQAIAELPGQLKGRPALLTLLPDVQVYHKAVQTALVDREFYHLRELGVAHALLDEGLRRAAALRAGNVSWTTAAGLVVRGYRSKIDGSVQPYGLVVPASYRPGSAHRHRLDVWLHGRGEALSELNFIDGRQRVPGEFTPADAFVLHPYGRYCNANKLAGEVDLFEALAHVRQHYSVDENRLVVRGFSMGGAACWQFAVHYPDRWAAAAPGAGFAETPEFLRVFQKETLHPTWYERKLWHLYDCTDYAINLFNCPTVAYSGERDNQKQAADVMAGALRAEGISLLHVIGPNTGHAYHPQAKEEINRRIDSIVARGRDPLPRHVRFTTWTLRYNRSFWVQVDGLDRHWERARVDAEIVGPRRVDVKTQNVSAVSLEMSPGHCPLDNTRAPAVALDGQQVQADPVWSDRSWTAHFQKSDGRWATVPAIPSRGMRKRHGLQGPIDDAFLDSFVMIRPTGSPLNSKVGAWAATEMDHAVAHWRRQFRGDAPVKDDNALTDADIVASNLVLWGDPHSNRTLARIVDSLPIQWRQDAIHVGNRAYSSDRHVLAMIYPNPLNPQRYVVLNSGFTFREYDYLNNARQVPKLPDYAIIDTNVPVSSRLPGDVVNAGFFGERWELGPASEK
jgi:pimeloyl-ACP methyl ester carboxylesterase